MLRRIGRIYWCKEGRFLNESISDCVPFRLLTKWGRLLSTIDDCDVDSPRLHQSDPPKRAASRSNNFNSPPGNTPNRPMRGDRRRPPVYPSAGQNTWKPAQFGFGGNENQGRGPDVEDSDFLEKFKLGFNKNKKENPVTKESSERDEDAVAAELPPQDADEIFKKMKERGLIPDAVKMLDGLCKDGLVQEAMKLFGLMREKGTIPEVVIYTAVVEGFCKAQKLDDAIRIFRKMQSNGVTPNAFSFGTLIQGLCRGERLDAAAEFCSEMLEAGHSPNVTTFVGLVDSFCRERGSEETQSLITTLRQKGFIIDEKAVRDYLDKKGRFSPLVWEAIFGKKASQKLGSFY